MVAEPAFRQSRLQRAGRWIVPQEVVDPSPMAFERCQAPDVLPEREDLVRERDVVGLLREVLTPENLEAVYGVALDLLEQADGRHDVVVRTGESKANSS